VPISPVPVISWPIAVPPVAVVVAWRAIVAVIGFVAFTLVAVPAAAALVVASTRSARWVVFVIGIVGVVLATAIPIAVTAWLFPTTGASRWWRSVGV
jgi:hypothetical protein